MYKAEIIYKFSVFFVGTISYIIHFLKPKVQFHFARFGHMANRQRDAFLASQSFAERARFTALHEVLDFIVDDVRVHRSDGMCVACVQVVFEDEQTASLDQ